MKVNVIVEGGTPQGLVLTPENAAEDTLLLQFTSGGIVATPIPSGTGSHNCLMFTSATVTETAEGDDEGGAETVELDTGRFVG